MSSLQDNYWNQLGDRVGEREKWGCSTQALVLLCQWYPLQIMQRRLCNGLLVPQRLQQKVQKLATN
jgi:hypothetical protein